MSTLAERLRNARVGAGLTQEQLASAVGVRRQAVNQWEHGKASPDTENLLRAAEACEVTVEELTAESPQLSTPSSPQAIKGWVNKHLTAVSQGLNDYLEDIIEAEVQRRLEERWDRYRDEQLATRADPAASDDPAKLRRQFDELAKAEAARAERLFGRHREAGGTNKTEALRDMQSAEQTRRLQSAGRPKGKRGK